jgi:tRNA-dihydrouridine synthase A
LHQENRHQKAVGIQIAGNDPPIMAEAAKIISKYNYNEININVGCPSLRVQNCKMGAALMQDPSLVSNCIRAIRDTVDLPLSIKTRIGVDDKDDYHFLYDFVAETSEAGCQVFIIHARKAFLQGLNPKQNRTIPPIDYEKVYRLKDDFNDLRIIINGEISSIEQIEQHLLHLDGVMIGRKAYKDPLFLAEIQQHFFMTDGRSVNHLTQFHIIKEMIAYTKNQIGNGINLHLITKHLSQLFKGKRGAKEWRNLIGGNQHKSNSAIGFLDKLLCFIERYEESLC